ncbi:MAG TPA: hypothetical protein VGM83_12015 [Devosiaceae bacterium]
MRSGWKTTILALATLMVTAFPAGAAEPIMVGALRLDLPKDAQGWTAKNNKDSVVLQKNFVDENGHKGGAVIQVTGLITKGALEDNFKTLAGTIPELRNEDAITNRKGVTVAGYPIHMSYICCGYRKNVSISSSVVGVQLPGGQQFMTLLLLNLDSDQTSSAEDDFAAAISSLRLKDDPRPAALVAPAGGGGIEGVYTSLHTSLMPNAFGGLDYTSENLIRDFDPSGIYSTEIPSGGIGVKELCARHPRGCGTYVISGGGLFGGAQTIKIAEIGNDYGIMDVQSQKFSRAGDSLKFDDDEYRPLPPLQRGSTFDGSWTYLYASSGMTATSSGGVSVTRTLVMKRDGSFRMTGFAGFAGSNTTGDTSTAVTTSGDHPTETGRYEVDGYSLKLMGSNGVTKTLSLFEPDVGSDGLLVIDGSNYLKDDGKN